MMIVHMMDTLVIETKCCVAVAVKMKIPFHDDLTVKTKLFFDSAFEISLDTAAESVTGLHCWCFQCKLFQQKLAHCIQKPI